jgi:hypothetical protein
MHSGHNIDFIYFGKIGGGIGGCRHVDARVPDEKLDGAARDSARRVKFRGSQQGASLRRRRP